MIPVTAYASNHRTKQAKARPQPEYPFADLIVRSQCKYIDVEAIIEVKTTAQLIPGYIEVFHPFRKVTKFMSAPRQIWSSVFSSSSVFQPA